LRARKTRILYVIIQERERENQFREKDVPFSR